MTPFPLVVDLDGTLVNTDLSAESFWALIARNALCIFAVLFWLCKGRAHLKRQISQRATVDVRRLPYHHEFLDYLKEQHSRGRRIVLATANDEQIAHQVADYLQLFDMILASNGTINLSGRHKRDRLVAEFGEKHFDYAGDSKSDLAVWYSSHRAILVNPTSRLSRKAARVAEIERVFKRRETWLKPYVQALRFHQWIKNLLVFVPLVLAHRFLELDLLANGFLAFLAFGLCASSVYLINDMVDLPADRCHPQKRLRPFAAGKLSLLWGLGSSPLLLTLSFCVCLALPTVFLGMLAIYYGLNLAYSLYLKKIVMLDVVLLAGLHTMRIMAGSASVAIWPSPWLLAFSTFLFLSLALVKRYGELVIMSAHGGETVRVRGYQGIDKELLASMGCGSGYVAVLVLAIYMASGSAELLYSRPQFLWLLCPLLLYWISYVWLIAHRGGMHDDPLTFTVRDRSSRVVLLLVVVTLMLAK
ncbi:MAG TPA: UbiA family prenyltransferase [Nitrospiraceae bacterium]|nr:UbiA family prenyltransferase [Nitrospiraceae bacterium]